jgi:DNA primase
VTSPGADSPAAPAADQRPQAAELRALAGRHLLSCAAEPDGWSGLLAGVAANLQHGFTGAVLIGAQAGSIAAASYDDWKAAGWQVRKGQHADVWVITGADGDRAVLFTRDQVRPSRRGASPPVPGAPAIAAGSPDRAAGALTALARVLGYTVVRPEDGGGIRWTDWEQHTITVSASLAPAAAAAALAHELAHILAHITLARELADLGLDGGQVHQPGETTAGCYGAAAVEADSAAWLVLDRMGVDPASAGITLLPVREWVGTDPRSPAAAVLTAAGERIVTAARQITGHAEKVLADMPPPSASAEAPGPGPGPAAPEPRGEHGRAPGRAAPPRLVVTDRPAWPFPDQDVVRVNGAAAAYFRACLPSSGAAGYLSGRGFGPGICRKWQLGYAPGGWTALRDHLRKAGYPDAVLEAAGLIRRSTRSGDLIDVFADRVMIPVRGPAGQIVGFAGRAPERAKEGTPKYLNTRATPAYQKDHLLFGLPEAAPALRAGARPVLVEGYLDVIAVDEAGRPEFTAFERFGLAAVAPGGTALSDHQMAALAAECDLVGSPLLCVLDPDAAGLKATLRDYPLIHSYSPAATTPVLPQGADPAEIFKRAGPAALARALATGEHPLTDVAVDAVLSQWQVPLDRGEAEGQLGAVRAAARMLAQVSLEDPARQIMRVADRTGLPHGDVAAEFAGVFVEVQAAAEPHPKAPGPDRLPHAGGSRDFPSPPAPGQPRPSRPARRPRPPDGGRPYRC